MRIVLVLLLLLGEPLVLAGCASPVHPAATSNGVQALQTGEGQALEARVLAATELRGAITSAIQIEDAPRKGKAKTLFVSAQVQRASEALNLLVPTSPYNEQAVAAYEGAARKFEDAYLASLLESTDPASQPLPWASNDGRDVLGSATVDAKLALWQAKDPAHPLVKFAIVRADDAGSLEVRVGAFDVGHVDIAGGSALSAGLLRTSISEGKTRVVAFENTSGGFRPGPLRNRTARAAMLAAGYLPVSSADLTVYDNPSGGYADSKLVAKAP